MQKGNINIPILIILILAGLVAFVFYDKGFDTKQIISLNQTEPTVLTQPKTSSTSAEIANWKTHTSSNMGISFKYPHDWYIEDYSNTESPYLRIQNYDPKTAAGRGYDPIADKGKYFLAIYTLEHNSLTINELKMALKEGEKGECLHYAAPSGIRVYANERETNINGALVYSRDTKCSGSDDSAWSYQTYFLDGQGKVLQIVPGLDVQSQKHIQDKIISTFELIQ
jgi:hypothetical protein